MTKDHSTIADLDIPDFMSPYRLSKLESQLRGKTVPPQKLYGYIRNGYLKASRNSTGKLQVARQDAEAYLTKQNKA